MKFAIVCASNQNRSMEAHALMVKKGLQVDSYGTNSMVKIPGVKKERPNVYPFGTSYEKISEDLKEKDFNFYTQNGLLMLLERNKRIKAGPERFQNSINSIYDIIVTCDQRCFDIVCDDLLHRKNAFHSEGIPVHIINIDIKDTHEDATMASKTIVSLCLEINSCNNLANQIEEILVSLYKSSPYPIQYTQLFY